MHYIKREAWIFRLMVATTAIVTAHLVITLLRIGGLL